MEATETQSAQKNDFSQGRVTSVILRMAIPTTIAQIINLLYNIVDRIYIGHIPGSGSLALTGLGIALPVISLVSAFTNLCGQGGAPLCSIARGKGDQEEAGAIMGNSLTMLLIAGAAVSLICFAFMTPLLRFFGASDATMPYARSYLSIYLLGTEFVMISTGMNFYINAQGFAKIGMLTVTIGAVLNLILDPVFIFALDMGVQGAALATILSQAVSAVWVLRFLTGKTAILTLSGRAMRLQPRLMRRILAMGSANFCFGATNSLVQMITNHTLQAYGGDLYVGVMTVASSLRELIMMGQRGFGAGAEPVISFNYGAGKMRRVKECIRFVLIFIILYSCAVCAMTMTIPGALMRIYTGDEALIAAGIPMVRIYFCCLCIMGLLFASQSTFTALGKPLYAVTFSFGRKVLIVVPLTLLLPRFLGTAGVFWAETVSDVAAPAAAFLTMWLTVYRRLGDDR